MKVMCKGNSIGTVQDFKSTGFDSSYLYSDVENLEYLIMLVKNVTLEIDLDYDLELVSREVQNESNTGI